MANRGWVPYLFIAALICSTASVRAEDDKNLQGGFFLSEEGCTGKMLSPKCVMSFQISGPAARTLYEKLKGKGAKDECTGGLVKTDGHGMRCFKTEGDKYDCDFGYSFRRGGLVESEVTC
jgi:hypothetical protein